jgi:GNAT superfamily N-acetyltransferase
MVSNAFTSLSAVIRGQPVSVRGRQRPIELLFNLEHPEQLEVVTEVNEEEDNHKIRYDPFSLQPVLGDPTYRRRGIARAAMSFIFEQCKGTHRIDLVPLPENKNVLRLYTSLGFKVEIRPRKLFLVMVNRVLCSH